jgi:hypothetical protein
MNKDKVSEKTAPSQPSITEKPSEVPQEKDKKPEPQPA